MIDNNKNLQLEETEYREAVWNYLIENDEFLSLSDEVWELAKSGQLPLENMLLELPMSKWVVQMRLLQVSGYNGSWEQVGQNLASICTRNDIRYTYFDAIVENAKMKWVYSIKDNVAKMSLETMTQIITEFAQANLNYMDYLYTEAAFEGDMELLSQEEKAAMWIANGLSMDVTQWRERLQCFSEAAKVCPMLGEFVKRYMQLYGAALMQ